MKKKSRKIVLGVSIVLASIFLCLFLNVIISKNTIEDYTKDYIVSQGYPAESIREIGIKHSYLNRMLCIPTFTMAAAKTLFRSISSRASLRRI
jgi:hypothetical protein